ncbi:phage transcriptional regulator%2C RinA family [uncultured Clostridium sp.]|nr:phage transcriptional regulator%2C RinA family [uncultured Clostridium sp.]
MKSIKDKLKNYHTTNAKLRQIEYEINTNNRQDLIEQKSLYEREIFTIDNALSILNKEERELIQYKYFDKLRWIDIEGLMGISRTPLINRHNSILKKLDEIINI